jgi:hypothetical protein
MIQALSYWQRAYLACRGCLVKWEGFPDVVCLLSMAEIKASLADRSGDADLDHAKEILAQLSRDNVESRFFFANLGTRWAQIICDWLEQAGKPRVLTGQGSGLG